MGFAGRGGLCGAGAACCGGATVVDDVADALMADVAAGLKATEAVDFTLAVAVGTDEVVLADFADRDAEEKLFPMLE